MNRFLSTPFFCFLISLGLYGWGSSVFSYPDFSLISTSLAQAAPEPQKQQEVKERLNKIFYWHLSDELKLSAEQEKNLVDVLNRIQSLREKALLERSAALSALRGLSKDAPLSKTKPHLDAYTEASRVLAQLEQNEYNELKAVIGEELLGRFYIIREDVTSRVRQALKK